MPKKIKGKKIGELTKIILPDQTSKILHKLMHPLVLEFHLRDVLQIMIGASILAIPVGYTEETWYLGGALPLFNILGFLFLSLLFVAAFVYYHYYKNHMGQHWNNFLKRVFFTYVLSFVVVGVLLTLIQRTPWTTDWILAFKRTVIVTFPASLSGAIADTIK